MIHVRYEYRYVPVLVPVSLRAVLLSKVTVPYKYVLKYGRWYLYGIQYRTCSVLVVEYRPYNNRDNSGMMIQ